MTAVVPTSRLLAGWALDGRPEDLDTHHRRHGPLPELGLDALADRVDAAGLRGRGGGGFPTARKLRAVAAHRRRPVVVANGCEGEPASQKDAALLACAPHLVLDGLVLAARALGATTAILAVHTAGHLREQLAMRNDPIPIDLREVPARYVASEETALVRFLSGGPATPTTSPPRPAERGVRGLPTLVDNVETLAQLALVARYGPEWFRSVGTPDLPGTLLVTAGGAIASPGVVEVPGGTPVRAVLDRAGGPTEPVQAVLSGGYGGAWLPVSAIDTPLTHAALRRAGSSLGVPILLALPARSCGLAQTAHLLHYLALQSAGQCGPCRFGLPAVTADLTAIACGTRDAHDAHARLLRRLDVVTGRGACALPDGAVRLARSAVTVFGTDLRHHLRGRPCVGAGDGPYFPLEAR